MEKKFLMRTTLGLCAEVMRFSYALELCAEVVRMGLLKSYALVRVQDTCAAVL